MCSCGLIFMLHIFWTVNVFDVIFASRGNGVSPFPPWQMGKTTLNSSTQSPDSGKSITSSMQNPGSRGVSLKDLDLLKGFRGSRRRVLICLEPVDEQLLQNQSPALISLPVSQSLEAGSSVCCYHCYFRVMWSCCCAVFFSPKKMVKLLYKKMEIITALSQWHIFVETKKAKSWASIPNMCDV